MTTSFHNLSNSLFIDHPKYINYSLNQVSGVGNLIQEKSYVKYAESII
jgi:hypothetical protein